MKAVKKRLLAPLLAVSLLLAAFLGARWLDRSREFSSLLPFYLHEVSACYATLEYFHPAQEPSPHIQLTQVQTQALLDQLSRSTYRREGRASSLHRNSFSDPDLSPHHRLQPFGADAERRAPPGQSSHLPGRFRRLPPGGGQSGPISGAYRLFGGVRGVTPPKKRLDSPPRPGPCPDVNGS